MKIIHFGKVFVQAKNSKMLSQYVFDNLVVTALRLQKLSVLLEEIIYML